MAYVDVDNDDEGVDVAGSGEGRGKEDRIYNEYRISHPGGEKQKK